MATAFEGEETSCSEDAQVESVATTDGDKSSIETEESDLTATKLQPILEKKIAFLSGAEHEGHPILTFASSGLAHLDSQGNNLEDANKTISFLHTFLTLEQLSKGILVVMDGRKPNLAQTVKVLLEMMASPDFCMNIHQLVLFKSSSLQQLSTSFTSYFSKSKAKMPKHLATAEVKEKIKVVSVHDKEELFQQVPKEKLTPELGGTLAYDYQRWLKNSLLYEQVRSTREKILTRFPDVRDGLNEFEVPSCVKDAERLMQQHLKLKEFFVNLFVEIDLAIDALIVDLTSEEVANKESEATTVVAFLSIPEILQYLNRTNEEVKEEQAEFEKFWATHKSRLDHIMRTCHFRRSVEKVRLLLQSHIDDLTGGDVNLGDSLEESLEMGEKHEAYVSTCKEKMDAQMKEIKDEGAVIAKLPGGESPSASTGPMRKVANEVRQEIQNLTVLYQDLVKLCQQKRDVYIIAVKFHMSVRQCEQWCSSVKEFTEITPTAESITPGREKELINETDALMKQLTQAQLNSLKELASCLHDKDIKKLSSKTLQKCNQGRKFLEEHKNKLLQLAALSYQSPSRPRLDDNSIGSSGSHSSLSPLRDRDGLSHTDSLSSSWRTDVGAMQVDSASLGEYVDEESDPAMLRGREYVYKEIVSTEEDYIKDLKVILDSYYNEMMPEDRVPLRLRGKREMIFGNLPEIYEFHEEKFLKAIQCYSENPERVGQCFLQHNLEFQKYARYCRKRQKSEALLTESPECQSFFKEIQLRLAHQLPLNSYLLKPVQRITKYQLLLKDMIKYSRKTGQSLNDLQMALDLMLKVLKNLNDSLHVVGLKGFPGSLAEQGRLLIHDPFQVWEVTGRNLLSRSHDRHIFLFERVIVFSKKKEQPQQQKHRDRKRTDSYMYKGHEMLVDVYLRNLMDSPVTFTVGVHGQNKMFKLQAPSKDVREMWVAELQRLLKNQFELLKDLVFRSGTLDRAAARRYQEAAARRDSRGKAKMYGDLVSQSITEDHRENAVESKKSFGNRFKLNFGKPKKKPLGSASSLQGVHVAASLQGPIPARGVSAAIISTSLGGAHGAHMSRRIADDMTVLSSSASTTGSVQCSGRAMSEDNLLDVPPSRREEWSDEEDDDISQAENYEILTPGVPRYYTTMMDYTPDDDDSGIPLKTGQEVEVLGVDSSSGWWLVRVNTPSQQQLEGWVPASHLQISNN